MIVNIGPSKAKGQVEAPPSKSLAHRMLICASLAEGDSIVQNIELSEDIKATLDCLSTLGVNWQYLNKSIYLTGMNIRRANPSMKLYCRESGSTMRFFVPLALLTEKKITLRGAAGLMKRPMSIYAYLAETKGFYYAQNDDEVVVQGPLPAGNYTVAGNISSQFISGLFFALPLLYKNSLLEIQEPVQSQPYIDLTIEILANFGIRIDQVDKHQYFISGGQKYQPTNAKVEADYSNAAFLDAFTLLGGNVEVTNLNPVSGQGDRVYQDYFKEIQSGRPTLSLENCPDLGPILFALAAYFQGATFTETRRLAAKESNRVTAMAHELQKMGVKLEIYDDYVVVPGGQMSAPTAAFEGHNDHRIVMACSVLASIYGGRIEGAEAVTKSYPSFFKTIKDLGIEVTSHAL